VPPLVPPVEPPSPPAPIAPRTPTPVMPMEALEDVKTVEIPRAAMDGLELADFSAEVAPLADLEPSEFNAGPVERLADFEPESASAPSVQPLAIEGMEEREFRPPADSGAFPSMLDPQDEPVAESSLLDLEVIGDPAGGPMASMEPTSGLVETTDAEFFAAGLDELSGDLVESAGPGVEAFHADAPSEFGALTDAVDAGDELPALPAEPEDPARAGIDETMELLAPPIEADDALDVLDEPATGSAPVTFVTETMAKVYLEQGLTDRAIDVYRQLVAQSPSDEGLRDRLRALETRQRASLEFEVPLDAVETPEPAPANAMLSAMSFDEVALHTPASGRAVDPVAPPPATPVAPAAVAVSPTDTVPEPALPTARDFFSAFARRGLSAAPPMVTIPTAAGSPLSPLDELFGPEVNVEDERAAHRLAAVGATSGPSGGTALDSLFGEGPSAPMPPELPSAVPGAPRVSRASEKLRFDQFFQSTSVASAATPTSMDDDSSPIVESSSYAGEGPSAPPEDDDLDQFQGWLRGLTK